MHWRYNDVTMDKHTCFDDSVIGFIYEIEYEDGRLYYGQKLIRSIVKLKPTKAQLAIRKNYSRKELKNKPFVNYVGSSKNTIHLTIISKKILAVYDDKINLTYAEQELLMSLDVLRNDKYLNDNIGGKFYRGRIH